jgi:hypothetical protein
VVKQSTYRNEIRNPVEKKIKAKMKRNYIANMTYV